MAALQVKRYMRKPLYVEAVQITAKNMRQVAEWCGGTVEQDGQAKSYIKVDVLKPVSPKLGMGYVGQWVLQTTQGAKIYNDRPFKDSFIEVLEEEPIIVAEAMTPAEKLLTDIFVQPATAA